MERTNHTAASIAQRLCWTDEEVKRLLDGADPNAYTANVLGGLFGVSAESILALSMVDPKHADRWWATYNAALTGLLAAHQTPVSESNDRAVDLSNHAHGPLVKP
jgi:hypothetical protein